MIWTDNIWMRYYEWRTRRRYDRPQSFMEGLWNLCGGGSFTHSDYWRNRILNGLKGSK